jgi:hypothetical protein
VPVLESCEKHTVEILRPGWKAPGPQDDMLYEWGLSGITNTEGNSLQSE